MLKFLNKKTQKMSALIMTGAFLGTTDAMATETLDKYMSDTSENVNSIPDAISFLSYLCGAGLAAFGVVGLKQHVENPQNTPLKTPLARLGFGGMLLAIPTITSVMQDTTQGTGSALNLGFGTEPSI